MAIGKQVSLIKARRPEVIGHFLAHARAGHDVRNWWYADGSLAPCVTCAVLPGIGRRLDFIRQLSKVSQGIASERNETVRIVMKAVYASLISQ